MRDDVVIAAPVRTPIGRFGGALASLSAVDLGVAAAKAALERAGIAGERVGQAIFGHARQAGCGPNPARQVAVRAGIPVEKPAFTINQACLSGMQAILAAVRAIRTEEAKVVLAGGFESMSRVPYVLDARFGYRMGHKEAVDLMARDGFLDPLSGKIMGETAETLARQYGITREEQDAYAALSQQRCEAARKAGAFDAEIVPVKDVLADEHPRDGVTASSLAGLKPVFEKDGTVTAGNSSGITDGAAAMIVLTAEAAERLHVEPLARIAGWRVDGVAPEIMGIGPVPAVRNLLEAKGLAQGAIDLVELNEAFAAQVLAVDRDLGFDRDTLNVNGGAIALGHPIGCSGARIVVTLLHEMAKRKARRGLATLCVSGGMGGALLLERP
ncbi:MAG TPA: acetyl-CoA C-acetyltransferase [Candidatus Polarisedimenticolaceae bacterium]|nr:acetyl-CoA C-acetyltransferase [Candidatus Polarisedimenticolaceae bacterium]